MKEVEGNVAFITGGSSGIGLGVARTFAEAGMKNPETRSELRASVGNAGAKFMDNL